VETELTNHFERVFLHENSRGTRLADRITSLFPEEKINWVAEKPLSHLEGRLSAHDFEQSKRLLYITKFEGSFFKVCPGSQNVACCNYFVLNLGLQCNMNCSYCYLQSYINSPLLTLYSNLEDALRELEIMGEKHSSQLIRVGTGEVMDSLSLDDLTLYSRRLIAFFARYPRWTLEFKTKSDKVSQFLDVPHAGNVIVSWSINPQNIISREEHKTASLEQRINAARLCVERGFKVAFHMDPMIWHEGWKDSYGELVDIIMSKFKPRELPHISLGALRFQPQQRHMMRERFGFKSLVTSAEVFMSTDGKLRYDQSVRSEMFSFIVNRFKADNPEWKVWLCMESPESWLSTFNATPRQVPELEPLFKPLPKVPRKNEEIGANP
jgi:spore photoproduct lyase